MAASEGGVGPRWAELISQDMAYLVGGGVVGGGGGVSSSR